jgi:hypothetical protein
MTIRNQIVTVIVLGSLSAAAAEEPTLKFPNYYRAYTAMVQCIGHEFFECDATSKTCFRGVRAPNGRYVGERLAEDRKTVLAHIYCQGTHALCWNLDTGEARIDDRRVPDFDYHHDLPAGEAEFETQRAQHCPHPR